MLSPLDAAEAAPFGVQKDRGNRPAPDSQGRPTAFMQAALGNPVSFRMRLPMNEKSRLRK